MEFAALCSAADRAAGERYAREGRRREWYAWRALLRSIEGNVEVGYDTVGAPVVLGRSGTYISVSHTEGYVAVMLADRPCGLDIELAGRDFARAVGRCANREEVSLFGGRAYAGAVLWCAKEAAYKWRRREGVDLKRDICIEAVDEERATGVGPFADVMSGSDSACAMGKEMGPAAEGSLSVNVTGERVAMRYSVGGGLVMVWTE